MVPLVLQSGWMIASKTPTVELRQHARLDGRKLYMRGDFDRTSRDGGQCSNRESYVMWTGASFDSNRMQNRIRMNGQH